MKQEIESAVQTVLQNPKVAVTVAAGTTTVGIEGWLFNVLPSILSIIASSVGIVLSLVLIVKYSLEIRKTYLETKKIKEKSK